MEKRKVKRKEERMEERMEEQKEEQKEEQNRRAMLHVHMALGEITGTGFTDIATRMKERTLTARECDALYPVMRLLWSLANEFSLEQARDLVQTMRSDIAFSEGALQTGKYRQERREALEELGLMSSRSGRGRHDGQPHTKD